MKRFIIFFSLIVAMTALVFSAKAIETGSDKNKASPVSVNVIQIAAENSNAEVMNFDQRQPMVASYAPSYQSLSNMNLQKAQTKIAAFGMSEQISTMKAFRVGWQANNSFLTSSTAQIANTQQVVMNLNFDKERFKKGSIVILKKPIMMSSSFPSSTNQTCSSDVKKTGSGRSLLICYVESTTSANISDNSPAYINKANTTIVT